MPAITVRELASVVFPRLIGVTDVKAIQELCYTSVLITDYYIPAGTYG